ncbi:MAG: hypothetical protein A2Y33_08815 [Spirochaetes bacterium GWF1_51_8]|nr:MAG: hypothetical protein A2Y33_08815 [Spirochaetes bacterium GWF1_51_8]
MSEMTIITIAVFGSSAMLFFILGIPMAIRKVKPNQIYGARTKYTLMDEEIWYDVNAVAGKLLMVTGVVLAAIAIVPVFYKLEKPYDLYYLVGGAGVEFILLILMTVKVVTMSRNMAREKGLLK